MNTNIRTKVVNDTNELIFKNKDLLVDNSPDSDTATVDNDVTVTIVQPKDTKYSIIVYIMEYRRSDEADIFEADTDEGHRETFKAAKGSIYLVVLLDTSTNTTSTDYYRLNTSSRGKLTSDITIKFKDDSPATNPDATITIAQSANQTIHVYTPQKSGGTDHTSSFTCPIGTTYEVEVIAASNYIAGTPNTKGGTFNGDMTINATAAVALQYTLAIKQTDHQLITVTANGVNYTKDVVLPYGTTYTVSITAETGYNAGALNKTSGTITGDETINATPATLATATITITQSDNQTIHVYTPQKSGGTDHTSTFTCPVGTTYEAEVIAENGYVAGELNVSGNGTINSDMSINATPAIKPQIYIAKGSVPWYNTYDKNETTDNYQWLDKNKIANVDESTPGQATVTCKDVTNMRAMFNKCSKLTSIDLSNFDTSKVDNMRFMLDGCSSLTTLDLSNFNTSNVTDMISMFSSCSSLTSLDLSNFDTSKVIDMAHMFAYCSNLASLDVSNFNTSNVTDMCLMFCGCSKFASLNVANFDTSKVTDMSYMFCSCSSLTTLDLSNFDTSKVDNMSYMFMDCSALTALNITNFNTSNVTDMNFMFDRCDKLTSVDLSSFDTSKVTGMSAMFFYCKSLTSLDLSKFNTSNVTNMCLMFCGCSSLTSLDLSNFDTSKVTDMWDMFQNCSNLTTIKGIIDMKSCTNYGSIESNGDDTRMFLNCPKLRNVKIKNPPAGFDGAGLSSSQYTIVS